MQQLTPEYIYAAVAALVAVPTLIQISPIKVDPWTWLARKVGRAINGELMEKFDRLESKVDQNQQIADERAAKDIRIRILRFGDEILHEREHSKEHFDQILQDITEYDAYCFEHPDFKNNMTHLTTRSIMETYSRLWEKHDFL